MRQAKCIAAKEQDVIPSRARNLIVRDLESEADSSGTHRLRNDKPTPCRSEGVTPSNDPGLAAARPSHLHQAKLTRTFTTLAYDPYFEKREETDMQAAFRGTRTLRFLWYEQRGLCPACNTKVTRITGWRLHYCIPRVMGGSQNGENRVLLHLECHDRVHPLRIPISKPRLPERGVRWARAV